MLELLRKSWWTISLRGLFIAIFGVLAIMSVQQKDTDAVAVAYTVFLKLGIMFALSGGLLMFVGIAFRKKMSNWFILIITAIPDLLLSAYIFWQGQDAAIYFAKIMGIWIIVVGLAIAIAAFRLKTFRILLLIIGLICVGFGLFVLLNKLVSLIVVYGTISYFTVLLGLVIIVLGFTARRAGRGKAVQPTSADTPIQS